MNKSLTVSDIAKMIDHSLLRPNLTEAEFVEGVELAAKYQMATCSVVPFDVARAAKMLEDSGVPVSTVVAFPHGTIPTETKVFEASKSIENGATELDMVMAISRMMAGDHAYVEDDIHAVVKMAHSYNVTVKVILENCYLTKEMIAKACQLSEKAGADFVKTSTGYGTSGATLEDIRLMRASCSPRVKIKAAGGIRTLDEVLVYRAAGTDRIATRGSQAILEEAEKRAAAGTLVEATDPQKGTVPSEHG
jgi:deoxyribose-phosphate aldolase